MAHRNLFLSECILFGPFPWLTKQLLAHGMDLLGWIGTAREPTLDGSELSENTPSILK